MILSVSGWRKVFTESGQEEDSSGQIGDENKAISALAAECFALYMVERTGKAHPVIAVGTDTRPTGKAISDAVIRTLITTGIHVQYAGVSPAPEFFAYARKTDGFMYISASHNPLGHNGMKFGLNDGGVLPKAEAGRLAEAFEKSCVRDSAMEHAAELMDAADPGELDAVYSHMGANKQAALKSYTNFMRTVIAGSTDGRTQDRIFSAIRSATEKSPLAVVCDMNGSARTVSIDHDFVSGTGVTFYSFNSEPGKIAHAIIPEPENLGQCAAVIKDMQSDGSTDVALGYMPDCDGDRGNLVYWSEAEGEAMPIPAQEVFALCTVAELSFEAWKKENTEPQGLLQKARRIKDRCAVVVNGPTSMRIDSICRSFGAETFRAEVGEANVVGLARKKRMAGYTVRILGEGSNGGNITHPSCVRDPLATLFAVIKLLTIRDVTDSDGTVRKGLYHIWCDKSGQGFRYRNDFTLSDVLGSLPEYKTTGVSEERAVLKVSTEDKGLLKERFKDIFLKEWQGHKDEMEAIYGIKGWRAFLTNGTAERQVSQEESWNNGNGGLKIQFLDGQDEPLAFNWMRPSGTEPVFRVMCDIHSTEDAAERSLLRWHTSMIRKADSGS